MLTRARLIRFAPLALLASFTIVGVASAVQDGAKPAPPAPGEVVGREFREVGAVAIEKTKGQVWFSEYERAYRVDVTLARALSEPALVGERFTAWVLTKDGRALKLQERPDKGPLVMTSTGRGSGTCHAIFMFAHEVKPPELAAIVVTVDKAPTAYAIPKP